MFMPVGVVPLSTISLDLTALVVFVNETLPLIAATPGAVGVE